MKVRLFFALASIFMPLSHAVAAEPQTRSLQFAMEAYDGHFRELCLDLQTGQTVELVAESPFPVRLNVHHHERAETRFLLDQVVESVRRDTVSIAAGGEYCLEVRNTGSQPSAFEVRLELRFSD